MFKSVIADVNVADEYYLFFMVYGFCFTFRQKCVKYATEQFLKKKTYYCTIKQIIYLFRV